MSQTSLPPRSSCTCDCHGGGILHAFPCCEPDPPKQEAMSMDRASVLDRIAEAKWEQYRAVDGQNRVPWPDVMEIHKDGMREEVAEYLDASGLLPHLEALQVELRHLKGRPAVPGKPLELQSRDELLLAINERDLLIESQQSMIRELDGKLAEVDADLKLKRRALQKLQRRGTIACQKSKQADASYWLGRCVQMISAEALAPQPPGAKPA